MGMAEARVWAGSGHSPQGPPGHSTAGIGASQGTGDGGVRLQSGSALQLSQHLLWVSVPQPLGLVAQLGAVGELVQKVFIEHLRVLTAQGPLGLLSL